MTDQDGFVRRVRAIVDRGAAAAGVCAEGYHIERIRHAAEDRAFNDAAGNLFTSIILPRMRSLAQELGHCRVPSAGRRLSCMVVVALRRSWSSTPELTVMIERRGPRVLAIVIRPDFRPGFPAVPGWAALDVDLDDLDVDRIRAFVEEGLIAFAESVVSLRHDPMYREDRFVLDPVCGMTIDRGRAAASARHGLNTFYFCAEECLRVFQAEPAAFARDVERLTRLDAASGPPFPDDPPEAT